MLLLLSTLLPTLQARDVELRRSGDNKVTFQEQILGVYLKPLPSLIGHHAMLSHFIS